VSHPFRNRCLQPLVLPFPSGLDPGWCTRLKGEVREEVADHVVVHPRSRVRRGMSTPTLRGYVPLQVAEGGSESEDEDIRHPGGMDRIKHFFTTARDFESVHANHRYTREERRRLRQIPSIDYLPPNSEVYREWIKTQPHNKAWDKWLMMFVVGLVTGVVGWALYNTIGAMAAFKYTTVRYLLGHRLRFVAWLFNSTFSGLLVLIAALPVVFLAPAAAGSGVPEVMAYLNGCMMPKIFEMKTLVVKFFSCAFAVASGLPAGPEGPMIHMGACIGAALSRGESSTRECGGGMCRRFGNNQDKRDFVTAGAAAGVAVAFRAPIGGLLFAFEEVASFWQQHVGWMIFFACMAGVLAIDLLNSAQRALGEGHFGLFESEWSVAFEVKQSIEAHLAAVIPTVIIGLLCGSLGIIFTFANLHIARFRDANIKVKKWKVLEPILLILLYVTSTMILPIFFPCLQTGCTVDEVTGKPTCPPGAKVQRVVENSGDLYTCQASGLYRYHAVPADKGGGANNTIITYNEMATLVYPTGEDTIRLLFTRGTHRQFSYGSLIVMFMFYFAGACWIAGSAISSGLFVPMLLIGACVGRIVGLATVDFAASKGWGSPGAPPGVYLPGSPWQWMDPGVMALVGAGSFMGGVTRLTISLAVIMMEMSGDIHFLLPILLGILVAKWIGDSATHSLYHGLLEVKCVPFLPNEPSFPVSLDLFEVRQIMQTPVATLRMVETPNAIKEVLMNYPHSGYPIVHSTPAGAIFRGFILRDHLKVILQHYTDPQSDRFDTSLSKLSYSMLTAKAKKGVRLSAISPYPSDQANGTDTEMQIDLSPYMDTSAITVQETFSVRRAYILFKTMALRHMVVIDDRNHVVGIMTRNDLLGYRLEDKLIR